MDDKDDAELASGWIPLALIAALLLLVYLPLTRPQSSYHSLCETKHPVTRPPIVVHSEG